jgi:hypothetical protein
MRTHILALLLASLALGADGQTPAPRDGVIRTAASVDAELRSLIDRLCEASELIVEGEIVEVHRGDGPIDGKKAPAQAWVVLHVTRHLWGYDEHEKLALAVPPRLLVDTGTGLMGAHGTWFLEDVAWSTAASAAEKALAESTCGKQLWSPFPRDKDGCANAAQDGTLTIRRVDRSVEGKPGLDLPRKTWRIDRETLASTIALSLSPLKFRLTESWLSLAPGGPVTVYTEGSRTMCVNKDGALQALTPEAAGLLIGALRDNHFDTLPKSIGRSPGPDSSVLTLDVREARGARIVEYLGDIPPDKASPNELDAQDRLHRILAAIPHAP